MRDTSVYATSTLIDMLRNKRISYENKIRILRELRRRNMRMRQIKQVVDYIREVR